MSRSSVLVCLVCAIFLTSALAAKNSNQAAVLASQAVAALTGGNTVNDVTLTGTVTRTAGSDVQTGTATLKALGTGDSRMDLGLPAGQWSDIRNLSGPNGSAQGYWISFEGAVHSVAAHNAFTDAAWFFPGLSSLSQASNSVFAATYVGPETRGNASVQHLQVALASSLGCGMAAPSLQQLSIVDFYLDSTSFLPVAVAFNTHPDDDMGTDIAVEIDFSNYQSVNGVQVPFRIQKLLNGSLFLDITVQNATINSGLTDADFAAPSGGGAGGAL
jgi:hypothetical protein